MNPDSPLSEANLPVTIQQLRAEITFRKIRDLFSGEGIDVLLLKGPHVGSTVYNSPLDRLYGDLDILVKPGEFDCAAALLLNHGFEPFAFDAYTPEIQQDFKHWEFRSPMGILVELHRWLSGHDRYPLDIDGFFNRAEKFRFGETDALGLGTEDLLLHLCLHMGGSFFHVIERKHVLDIALLTRKRLLNWDDFLARCRQFRMQTIVYYSLLAAREQDGGEIPEAVLARLRPGWLRRLWLGRYLSPGNFPIYRFPKQNYIQIKVRLLFPLIDHISDWPRYVIRLGRVYGKSLWQGAKKKVMGDG